MHTHFQGILTADDVKQHIAHTFEVPAGVGQLNIRFRYAPARVNGVRNMLCLSLFDPFGFRGAGHRSNVRQTVHISAAQATPGYRPGAVPAGTWTVEIDTHMILPGPPCRYWLDVSTEAASEIARSKPRSDSEVVSDGTTACLHSSTRLKPEGMMATPPSTNLPVTARGAGWYRGDLHAHTVHSDGDWAVAELLKAARAQGLDFVALTDHNTVSGLDEMAQASPTELLTLPGMELTTFWGHALSLGTRDWIDWRVRLGERSICDVANAVAAAGGLFVIAHPGSVGDPTCTGCDWRYLDMMPGPARVVEVWNGPWDNNESGNERSLAIWYDWLNQGHRLAATAGSDAHSSRHYTAGPGFNVIHADSLAQDAILQAVARGHLYLSAGPRLEMTGCTPAGQQAMMGDKLSGAEAEITVHWEGCPRDARLRLIADGKPLEEWRSSASGERVWTPTPGQARWCLVELRDRQGCMLALTNPIFLDIHS